MGQAIHAKTIKRSRHSTEPVIRTGEMLTSWYFWKPILITIFSIFALIGCAYIIKHYDLIEFVILSFIAIMFFGILWASVWGLYAIGKSYYTEHMRIIKANFEELTDEKWDEFNFK